MSPTVSVIIPTWNRSIETEHAVTSVLHQTFKDFEIIVADDGSTDNTQRIFENYQDPRVKYLRINHSGLPAAPRNAAIHIAQGKWIAFLDSDDRWSQKKLSIQIGFLDNHPEICLTFSNAYRVINDKRNGTFFPVKNNIKNSFTSLIDHNNFIINSSAVVRKDVIEKYGGLSEEQNKKGIEDFDLWTKICIDEPFYYLNQPLIDYTDEPSQSVRSEVSFVNYKAGMLDIYERTYDSLIKGNKLTQDLACVLERRIYTYRRELNHWNIFPQKEVNQQKPTVSIILPVYNGEKFIQESIYSILSQTYTDFELIIINDGSIDNTGKLLSTMSDPRIRVITQSNQGIVAALNNGIEHSRGKYIARQDHDDISFRTRIAKQVRFLDENPEYGLIGTWSEVWDENNVFKLMLSLPSTDFFLRERLLFDNPFIHSSVIFRRSLLEICGPYDPEFAGSAMEDYELWSRMSNYCKIANLSEILQVYREVSGSITKTKTNNFSFREEVARSNFNQYIDFKQSKKEIGQLIALAVDDNSKFDPFISFSDCKIVYIKIIEKLQKITNTVVTKSDLDKKSIMVELRTKYFMNKIHLPWRYIIKVEKRQGYLLLRFLEKWEEKSPGSFSFLSKASSMLYGFFLGLFRKLSVDFVSQKKA